MPLRCAVIGLGTFGRAVALRLAQGGAEVIVLDRDRSKIEAINEDVSIAIVGDATNEKVLKEYMKNVDVAVVAIGETFEGLLLCTVHLLNMKIPRVIARAFNATQRLILEKLGVHEIVSPEEDAGNTLAERILHPVFRAYIPLPDDYEIVEVPAPGMFHDRTVREIDFPSRYNLTLVTIKRPQNGNRHLAILGCVRSSERIRKGDMLVLMGHRDDIDRFMELAGIRSE